MYLFVDVGPDDYVESTQKEREVIQILCDEDDEVPHITLSDSDSEPVAPTPPRRTQASRMRLKLTKSNGECLCWSWKKLNEVE